MHSTVDQLQVIFEAGGASIRSLPAGAMFASIVEVPAGADFTAALEGLPDDLCPSAHWGYMLEGTIHLRYRDGSDEATHAGDIFYWPAGHTAWTAEGARFVEISPQDDLTRLLDHMKANTG
jgi:hypothetical protein